MLLIKILLAVIIATLICLIIHEINSLIYGEDENEMS
jgi:hypothetical protein